MEEYLMVAAAFFPAVALAAVVYFSDKYQREPLLMIAAAFLLGILSTKLAGTIEEFVLSFWKQPYYSDFIDLSFLSFGVAAIPEELMKALMLFAFLWKNKEFDECIDGIVYAVAISMGFAAYENCIYLFRNEDAWQSLAVARALFSVPGHYLFAIAMGYYYSLWRLRDDQDSFWKIFLIPIAFHGVYDFVMFWIAPSPVMAGAISSSAQLFLLMVSKYSRRHLLELLVEDHPEAAEVEEEEEEDYE